MLIGKLRVIIGWNKDDSKTGVRLKWCIIISCLIESNIKIEAIQRNYVGNDSPNAPLYLSKLRNHSQLLENGIDLMAKFYLNDRIKNSEKWTRTGASYTYHNYYHDLI